MDKRYQVFISSTYTDLKEERQIVTQAIMKMDCIPAGMELFPAADQEQFEFIKRVIDDCDYYIIIVGARYGSCNEDGLSYTEMEYDYAVEKGLKVLAFIHGDTGKIPLEKTDQNSASFEKLTLFKSKILNGRLVEYWNDANELSSKVILGLLTATKMFPAIGWVRANQAGSLELLNEINELRKANSSLQLKLNSSGTLFDSSKLVNLEQVIEITGTCFSSYHSEEVSWEELVSWERIFSILSPYLIESYKETLVKTLLRKSFFPHDSKEFTSFDIDSVIFQKIKVQLIAYGFIEIRKEEYSEGKNALFWRLTDEGKQKMFELNTAQKDIANA